MIHEESLTERAEMQDERVKAIVERLFTLQRKFYGATWPKDVEALVKDYTMLINVELVECLQNTNFKAHKKLKPVDIGQVQEEAIDALIFCLELVGAVFDADFDAILNALDAKSQYNETRKDWEVNRKQGER